MVWCPNNQMATTYILLTVFMLTPPSPVANTKSKSVVELLIKKGADVNMTNKEGATALHKATEINNTDVMTIVLRHGAKVSHVTEPRHRAGKIVE